jgi:hypothetical protein
VTIQNRKDIDSIYDEVEDYDLVLTADAPLSDAINRRLETPVFGEFANTPRRIVRDRHGDPLERRDLFAKAVRETDMTWKQASYLLDLVVECWQHTGNPTEVLDTRFASSEMERMVEIVRHEDSIYSLMDSRTVGDDDVDVAVVGWHDFDELDKSALPPDYDRVSIFTDEAFSLPEFRVFESATSLVEAVRDNVTAENADRVAVVAETGSKKERLVKSALEADGVPYVDSTSVSGSDDLRTLLRLLRVSLSSERVKVSGIRPILRRIAVDDSVPTEKDEVYLPELNVQIPGLDGFLSGVDDMTFSDAVDTYESLVTDTSRQGRDVGEDLEDLREALGDVDMLDTRVTDAAVNRLRYYLDSFDIGGDSDAGGVLFADPSSSTADRPVVMYLDMSESWTPDIPDRPWIDRDVVDERHIKGFQALIQNGDEQYYLVQETEGSDTVTPTSYFRELADDHVQGTLETFTDFENHARYTGVPDPERAAFEPREDVDVTARQPDTVSQSSLNKFVESPRAYFFSRLVEDAENKYTVRGNLLHDFAEFYTNYGDFVRSKGLEAFVDETIERISPYVDPLETPILRTRFLEGAKVIMEYLDEVDPPEETPQGYEKEGGENVFAELYDRPIRSGATELRFENHDVGGHGRVDLVEAEDALLDYKTGSKDSLSSVIGKTKVSTHEPDDVDFQPILYLAHHRDTVQGDDTLTFTLLHMLDGVGDRISEATDHSLEDNFVEVPYIDMSFEEYISTRGAFDELCDVGIIKRSFDKMGYEPYRDFFEGRDLPEDSHDREVLREELLDDFTEYVKGYVGEYNYVRDSCRSALGNIAGMRSADMLFRDDVDEFEGFVDDKISELNECRRTRFGFPVGDIDVSELREEELILERTGTDPPAGPQEVTSDD